MLNACVLLKVIPVKASTILETVREMRGIRKAYFTYGRFDIVVFLAVDDYRTLRKVTGEINSIEGVRSTETLAEA
ncbi:MAG: hypothetical protein GTN80_08680 [Nitrososphaeria archaeon]|nr:hypothetical protein [Nitrososphaeria archaeon]NIQ33694.1 hypothetical protein [Nitrososphaeria archaeon]